MTLEDKLLSQIKKQKDYISDAKSQISVLSKQINNWNTIIKNLEEQIKNTKTKNGIEVSDHSIVRYLERVYKLNLSDIKSEIIPKDLESKMLINGNGTYKINGVKYVVKDYKLITIID